MNDIELVEIRVSTEIGVTFSTVSAINKEISIENIAYMNLKLLISTPTEQTEEITLTVLPELFVDGVIHAKLDEESESIIEEYEDFFRSASDDTGKVHIQRPVH